tara:strand:- start:195 stop:548 length:354 start_codon:yes stop_codon:yes gene_type:complete
VKLTKSQLKGMIKEILEEDFASTTPAYSSREAKTIIEKSIEDYAKVLRKAQYKIIKDWMSKAKAGVLDFYDINRGIKTNQVSRTYPYEADFLRNVLLKDKIIDRFKKYFGGRKGKKR